MRKLVIYGDGIHAERIFQYVQQEKEDFVVAFTNEDQRITRKTILGCPVIPLSELDDRLKRGEYSLLIAFGYSHMNDIRKKVFFECKNMGYKVATYISPQAMVYSSNIGEGTIVLPGAFVGLGTVIGNCCLISETSYVGHNITMKDFVFVSANVAIGGYVRVGNNCFIGVHSTIKDGVTVGDYTLVGAAANIVRDTEDEGVYVGNPAKKLLHKSIETKI